MFLLRCFCHSQSFFCVVDYEIVLNKSVERNIRVMCLEKIIMDKENYNTTDSREGVQTLFCQYCYDFLRQWKLIKVGPEKIYCLLITSIRSSLKRCSVKKGVKRVFRNFRKFTGKHLCQILFDRKHKDMQEVKMTWRAGSKDGLHFEKLDSQPKTLSS